MREKPICFFLFLGIISLSGCGAFPLQTPVSGLLFTQVKAPVAVGNSPTYSKVGRAEAASYLGLIAIGDASIQAAMKQGNITQIHHVDSEAWHLLGIVATYTVIVYGD